MPHRRQESATFDQALQFHPQFADVVPDDAELLEITPPLPGEPGVVTPGIAPFPLIPLAPVPTPRPIT